MKRKAAMLAKFGITVPKDAQILDFGCGDGRTVDALLAQGYVNAVGYDIKNTLSLRALADRSRFFISDVLRGNNLPFDDNSFDLVISEQVLEHVMDQVSLLRELHRVMRPGGCAIHEFPSRYSPLEVHVKVPLGGVMAHRWWYKLWALLGIRNEYQKGLSADEVADRNTFYFVEGLNYVSNSCYKVVWRRLGYEYHWLEQECFDTSERRLLRAIGRLNRILPLIGWLYRTFHSRRVLLIKPAAP